MKKLFAANWKLNKSPSEARKFIEEFQKFAANTASFFDQKEVVIFPSAFSLEAVSIATEKTQIQFGPQNVYFEKSGAFTGENSASVAVELGSKFILIGHSERRQFFHESDLVLNNKVKFVQSLNVTPVFCIGETLEQREANKTEEVCFHQLEKGLRDVDQSKKMIIAYEPVWAIGTGKVATAQQVADIHLKLHHKMTQMGFTDFQLLYGGSVKPENSSELLKISYVDGFLVGGAALDPQSFFKICTA